MKKIAPLLPPSLTLALSPQECESYLTAGGGYSALEIKYSVPNETETNEGKGMDGANNASTVQKNSRGLYVVVAAPKFNGIIELIK